jgi:Peptidase A4 family
LARTYSTALASSAFVTILVLSCLAAASPLSGQPQSEYEPHGSHPHIRYGASSSLNWAGYAVTGAAGSVSDVKGSWIVPSVTCSPSQNAYSAFWTGIDGYSSSTVEQTGTDSDCQSGSATYYAWFEFYPNPSFLVSGFTVTPGDQISAEVSYSGGMFTTR